MNQAPETLPSQAWLHSYVPVMAKMKIYFSLSLQSFRDSSCGGDLLMTHQEHCCQPPQDCPQTMGFAESFY